MATDQSAASPAFRNAHLEFGEHLLLYIFGKPRSFYMLFTFQFSLSVATAVLAPMLFLFVYTQYDTARQLPGFIPLVLVQSVPFIICIWRGFKLRSFIRESRGLIEPPQVPAGSIALSDIDFEALIALLRKTQCLRWWAIFLSVWYISCLFWESLSLPCAAYSDLELTWKEDQSAIACETFEFIITLFLVLEVANFSLMSLAPRAASFFRSFFAGIAREVVAPEDLHGLPAELFAFIPSGRYEGKKLELNASTLVPASNREGQLSPPEQNTLSLSSRMSRRSEGALRFLEQNGWSFGSRMSKKSEEQRTLEQNSVTASSHSSKKSEDDACAICLEFFVKGDAIRTLPCRHFFHENCVDTWLKRTVSCPLRCPNDIEAFARMEQAKQAPEPTALEEGVAPIAIGRVIDI